MTKKSAFFLLLIIFFWLNMPIASSQKDGNIDSLLQVIEKGHSNSFDVINAKVYAANYFLYHDLDKTAEYINPVVDYPNIDELLPKEYSRHFLVKAWLHQGRNEFESSKEYMFKAYDVIAEYGTEEELLEIQINLGSLLVGLKDSTAMAFVENFIDDRDTLGSKDEKVRWILGHYYKARILGYQEKYKEALEVLVAIKGSPLFEESPDYRYGILNSMAIFLGEIGDHELAIKTLKESLEIKGLYDFEKKMLYQNLAEAFFEFNEDDSCRHYLQIVHELGPLSPPEGQLYYLLKAKVDYKNNDYNKAAEHIQQAREAGGSTQDKEVKLTVCLVEARIRCERKEWQEAEQCLIVAREIIQQQPILKTLDIETTLTGLDLSVGLSKRAPTLLSTFKNYSTLKNQEAQQKADKELKSVLVEYEAIQLEQENELLKRNAEITQQARNIQMLLIIGLLGILLAAFWLAAFWRKNHRISTDYNALLEQQKERLSKEKEQLAFKSTSLESRLEKNLASPFADAMIEINSYGVIHQLSRFNILSVNAEREGARFHLKDDPSKWFKLTLKDAKEKLEQKDKGFIQVNKSWIVHRTHIKTLEGNIITTQDGATLKVGRPFLRNVKRVLDNQ